MADSYIGEIRLYGGSFAPAGWAFCDGSLIPIPEYQPLFDLIGTTFGGNGTTNFALPDLRGRAAIGAGNGTGLTPRTIGQTVGTESVALTAATTPQHNHLLLGSADPASATSPEGKVLAATPLAFYSTTAAGAAKLATQAITAAGGDQPHENRQPLQVQNFIISLYGYSPK